MDDEVIHSAAYQIVAVRRADGRAVHVGYTTRDEGAVLQRLFGAWRDGWYGLLQRDCRQAFGAGEAWTTELLEICGRRVLPSKVAGWRRQLADAGEPLYCPISTELKLERAIHQTEIMQLRKRRAKTERQKLSASRDQILTALDALTARVERVETIADEVQMLRELLATQER